MPFLAVAIFDVNAPFAKKIEFLSPMFSPAPGQELRISEHDRLRKKNASSIKRLRGYIKVSPPANSCLTITKANDSPSDYICKPTDVAFQLGDINSLGQITWEIKTGISDPGTKLTWKTPYRVAMAVPRVRDKELPVATSVEFWQSAPPEYLYIESCNYSFNTGRHRIELDLFSGKKWIVNFPTEHKRLAQPNDIPNLIIASGSGKRSLDDAAKDKKNKDEKDKAKKKDPEKSAPKVENPEVGGVPDEKTGKDKTVKPNDNEDRKLWTITLRNSYEMSAENFHPDNSTTPGATSVCRYNFSGPKDDPLTGRLECQSTAEFHMVLIPLTCLHQVAKN